MTNGTEQPRGPSAGSWVLVVIAWTLVGLPLAWGVSQTLQTAVRLFR